MGIDFEQVSFAYRAGQAVPLIGLDALDLKLAKGRFTAVLGAPGSGKSTLLQHVNGILRPSSGRIRIFDCTLAAGAKATGLRQLRKRVGLVFQFPEQQLFEDTVEKDLMFGPRNFGMSEREAKEAAKRTAAAVGLDPSSLGMNPYLLSGGQMRLAAIAAVLAAEPDVLVLDEPAASLDQTSRDRLMRLLFRLCREQGKTVIVVTHRLEEVMELADEYVVMKQGRAVFHGSSRQLLLEARTLEEAGLTLPRALRFLVRFAEKFAAEPFDGPFGVREIAAYVEQVMESAAAGGRIRKEVEHAG